MLKSCKIGNAQRRRPAVGPNAMKTSVRTFCLLLACICVPFHSSAQSKPSRDISAASNSGNTVSVRELTIPAKALRAFEQGAARLEKQDPAGSLPYFRRAIAEYAGYYEAYDRIGAADLKLRQLPEAEQAFRKSIEVSGGQFAHPLIALGAILDDRDQFIEAESVIHRGLGLDPESWTGHYYLGLALFGLNRLEDAEKSLQASLHWKPDFPQAHLILAEIHSRAKDYRALLEDLDEYLRLEPDGPTSAAARALRESTERRMTSLQSNASFAPTLP